MAASVSGGLIFGIFYPLYIRKPLKIKQRFFTDKS
nr:MAG TPA: hypothetical protein [Bacteriophage sp.]